MEMELIGMRTENQILKFKNDLEKMAAALKGELSETKVTSGKATTGKATIVKTATRKTAARKAAAGKATARKAVAGKAVTEKAVAENAIAEKAIAEKAMQPTPADEETEVDPGLGSATSKGTKPNPRGWKLRVPIGTLLHRKSLRMPNPSTASDRNRRRASRRGESRRALWSSGRTGRCGKWVSWRAKGGDVGLVLVQKKTTKKKFESENVRPVLELLRILSAAPFCPGSKEAASVFRNGAFSRRKGRKFAERAGRPSSSSRVASSLQEPFSIGATFPCSRLCSELLPLGTARADDRGLVGGSARVVRTAPSPRVPRP